ncbi:MAG: hypothetical protein ACRCYY_07330 [Trueperaceae bacterium]
MLRDAIKPTTKTTATKKRTALIHMSFLLPNSSQPTTKRFSRYCPRYIPQVVERKTVKTRKADAS